MIVEPTTKVLWRKKCMRARGRYVLCSRSTAFSNAPRSAATKTGTLDRFLRGEESPRVIDLPARFHSTRRFCSGSGFAGIILAWSAGLPVGLVLFDLLGGGGGGGGSQGMEAVRDYSLAVLVSVSCTWFGKFGRKGCCVAGWRGRGWGCGIGTGIPKRLCGRDVVLGTVCPKGGVGTDRRFGAVTVMWYCSGLGTFVIR